MGDLGQIGITVSGTTYNLMTDLRSISEVDIVDFAPGAVGGTAWSELGLYVDLAQDMFGHGFGRWTFSEPASYAYTGSGVDTRHGYITHFTTPTTEHTFATATAVNKLIIHRNLHILADNNSAGGIHVRKPSDGTWQAVACGFEVRDIVSTGTYIMATQTGRMQVMDISVATAGGASTITNSAAGWTTNIFQGGTIYIYDGTSVGDTRTVASNTATTITVTAPFTATPTTSSYFIVWYNTGSGVNTPTGFDKLVIFGGYYWSYERGSNRLHYWAEESGSDAEGGTADADVIYVGARGGVLLNLAPYANLLYAFRQDGVWTIGEDNLAYHPMDFIDQLSTNNFKTVCVWQGFMYFAVRNILYKYKSGLQDVTPPRFNDKYPYKGFGNFRGMVVRGRFLYMLAQCNTSNASDESEEATNFVALLATDGVGWHKLWTMPLTTPTGFGMWLDPYANKLFVYGKPTTGAAVLYSFQFQAYSDLPYDTYPITGSQTWYSSYFDCGYPRIVKSFESLTIHGEFPSTANTTTVTCEYRTDDATTWTALSGTFNSDMDEVFFPSTVQGKRIQLRLTLDTTSASYTPCIKAVILKLMIRPDVLYGVTCDVLVSDKLSDQNRRMLGLTAAQIRTALKATRASTAPITLRDVHGSSNSAYLASLRFNVVEYEDTPDEIQEIARCSFVYVG